VWFSNNVWDEERRDLEEYLAGQGKVDNFASGNHVLSGRVENYRSVVFS
jgi:hypothetical protein